MWVRASRTFVGAVTVIAASLPVPGLGAADPVTFCTWGGTPEAATGTVTIKPGLTNTPAADPVRVVAKGWMDCTDGFGGPVTFDGVIQAGGTCVAQVFDGKIKGLPGVARAFGPGVGGVIHEFLYDKDGNIVGSDQPQVLSGATGGGSELSDCNTQEGFTDTVFSSSVELWR